MSIYSDKLTHIRIVINSVAQMCTREDMLAHYLGALFIDDVMKYNTLITKSFWRVQIDLSHYFNSWIKHLYNICHEVLNPVLNRPCIICFQVRCSLSSRGNAAASTSTSSGLSRRRSLVPVLGHDDRLVSDSLSIQKNCGTDNVCIPNLSVDVSQ